MDNRAEVKAQFGANAEHYVDSKPHAKGASLKRLTDLVNAQPTWQALDIATATGHTALAFAPFVAHVTATDITPEMLPLAEKLAQERGISNLSTEIADAEDLPYEDAHFDLVTCRIAPHHFPDIMQFLREGSRVLKPGGILAVVDNVVPDGEAGEFANQFEKLRDPSHGRCFTLAEWIAGFEQVGLTILQQETLDKEMEFASWAGRHDEAMQNRLRTMLAEASDEAKAFFRPETRGDALLFHLEEALVIGQK